MSHKRLARSLAKAASDASDTAAHSAVTISARLPILAGCLVSPSTAGIAEWNEACSEKVSAGVEGVLAAAAEWQAMMFRSAFRVPTPLGFANDMMRVVSKAAHPTHRRAKANGLRYKRSG